MKDHYQIVKEYWESIASSSMHNQFKDHWIDDSGAPLDPAMFNEVAEYVSTKAGDRSNLSFLEVGCGTGRVIRALRTIRKDAHIVGLDFSPTQITNAIQTGGADGYHCGDFLDLFRNNVISPNSMDCIYLHSVTQYFPSYEYFHDFLTTSAKVLRPDGVLILIDVPIDWYSNQLKYGEESNFKAFLREKFPSLVSIIRTVNRSLFSRNMKETLGGETIESAQFNGFYVDIDRVVSDSENIFEFVDVYVQLFQNKPIMYRKYRPNIIFRNPGNLFL